MTNDKPVLIILTESKMYTGLSLVNCIVIRNFLSGTISCFIFNYKSNFDGVMYGHTNILKKIVASLI